MQTRQFLKRKRISICSPLAVLLQSYCTPCTLLATGACISVQSLAAVQSPTSLDEFLAGEISRPGEDLEASSVIVSRKSQRDTLYVGIVCRCLQDSAIDTVCLLPRFFMNSKILLFSPLNSRRFLPMQPFRGRPTCTGGEDCPQAVQAEGSSAANSQCQSQCQSQC